MERKYVQPSQNRVLRKLTLMFSPSKKEEILYCDAEQKNVIHVIVVSKTGKIPQYIAKNIPMVCGENANMSIFLWRAFS